MTLASALSRLDIARDYLDETMMSLPCDRDFIFAEQAKRKAAWRSYFVAQATVRQASRTLRGETQC